MRFRIKGKWRVGALFIGLVGVVAIWPVKRLELEAQGRRVSKFVRLPSNGYIRVVYHEESGCRVVIRRFRLDKRAWFRLVETAYVCPPRGLERMFNPENLIRQGDTLFVRGAKGAVPALHFVISTKRKRILILGDGRNVDLSRLFTEGAVVSFRVVQKPWVFFWWRGIKVE